MSGPQPSHQTNIDEVEDKMNQQSPNLVADVLTIGVPVSDQDRALAFYLDKLGFEKRRDVPLPRSSGRWIEVAPSDATVTLALIAARADAPTGVETGIRLKTGDADEVHTRLQGRGVDVGELLRWPGVPPMFAFRDQDGNGLEIVEAA